jgi:hypothetical protein
MERLVWAGMEIEASGTRRGQREGWTVAVAEEAVRSVVEHCSEGKSDGGQSSVRWMM